MRQVLFCFETRTIQSSKVILREHAFQFFCRQPQMERAVEGHGYAAGLFGDDDHKSIAGLRHSQSSPMAQSQRLGDILVVRYRQDATGRFDSLFGNNHRAVVQR